jgi:hypothetical protein
MALRRKKPDSGALEEEIARSRASAQEAQSVRHDLEEAKPKIESIVSFLSERRQTNHFGRDFQIVSPRRPS